MTRQRLPHRRRTSSATLSWNGQPLHVSVGFDAAGAPREVFANGPKQGSDMAHVLADACVIVSIALQYGVPPAALGRSLGTVPGRDGPEPASPIGLIAAHLAGAAEPPMPEGRA